MYPGFGWDRINFLYKSGTLLLQICDKGSADNTVLVTDEQCLHSCLPGLTTLVGAVSPTKLNTGLAPIVKGSPCN